ncbi:hypothetical protein VULLAG_LOCUS11825 [Vulpes lagopus]
MASGAAALSSVGVQGPSPLTAALPICVSSDYVQPTNEETDYRFQLFEDRTVNSEDYISCSSSSVEEPEEASLYHPCCVRSTNQQESGGCSA